MFACGEERVRGLVVLELFWLAYELDRSDAPTCEEMRDRLSDKEDSRDSQDPHGLVRISA